MTRLVALLVVIAACNKGESLEDHVKKADQGEKSKTTESICYLAKHAGNASVAPTLQTRFHDIVDDEAATQGWRQKQLDCIAEGFAAAPSISADTERDAVRGKLLLATPAIEKLYAKVSPAIQKEGSFALASELATQDHIAKRGSSVAPRVQLELERLGATADERFVTLIVTAAARWEVGSAKLALAKLPAEQQIAAWRAHLKTLSVSAAAGRDAAIENTLKELATRGHTLDESDRSHLSRACEQSKTAACAAHKAGATAAAAGSAAPAVDAGVDAGVDAIVKP